MPVVVKFLANEVVCTDMTNLSNEEMRILAAKGYKRICLVSVPPILGVTVGGLLVAWNEPLLPAAEQRAELAMKAAALKFAIW
jgi:lipopolysaccharide export LptBFGC system permease protein LptF